MDAPKLNLCDVIIRWYAPYDVQRPSDVELLPFHADFECKHETGHFFSYEPPRNRLSALLRDCRVMADVKQTNTETLLTVLHRIREWSDAPWWQIPVVAPHTTGLTRNAAFLKFLDHTVRFGMEPDAAVECLGGPWFLLPIAQKGRK